MLQSEPMPEQPKKRDWEQLRRESRFRNRLKEAASHAMMSATTGTI